MEDENQYFQQHEKLRKKQFKEESSASSTIFEKQVYDQRGIFKLKKKHRFPFKVTCFENVGKKIVLGSDEGSLYAYQVLQTEQKQDFKLLYIEQNAHPNSHVSQLIHFDHKKRNANYSFKQEQEENLMNEQIKKLEKVDRNFDNDDEIYLSQADNQSINPSPNSTNKFKNLLNQNTNYPKGSIISRGLYDRKIILWSMTNKFEKKAESQVFKTYIYHIATDDHFAFVATLKKVYALSLDTLSVCMKFGIPNYKSLDFLISSITCISLTNSNILIAGTDCYSGNNYFISLWEYPKNSNLNLEVPNSNQDLITPLLNSQNFENGNQMNLEDDELNFDIDDGYYHEEQKENNNNFENQSMNSQSQSNQQTPQILNDIEDLDNFDIDGDFPDTSTNNQLQQQQLNQQTQNNQKEKKIQRRSFWQPTLLEFCHNSRIKQLKYNSNNQQLISVGFKEVNIWKIQDEKSQQQNQQINYQTEFTQNMTYQCQVNFYEHSSKNTQAKMAQNQQEAFMQKPQVLQVFSLQLNNERNVNVVIEKQTNNILLFLDQDVLSFDSNNYKLNFQSNISSSNHELSHLYFNPATQQENIYSFIQNLNRSEITQPQPTLHPHKNHYLLVQSDVPPNQDHQSITKFIITACEIEQIRNKTQQKQKNYHSILEHNKFSQEAYLDKNLQSTQEKHNEMSGLQNNKTNFECDKEMNSPQTQQSPEILLCQKKLIQSPVNVPPVQKYSTAHIIPSAASYTVLMNKLKKIEQNNTIQRQINASSQVKKSSQSSTNFTAVQQRKKPKTNEIRSNSKCIKKQLKRHVKYSNKKKKQNLVKVFSNQATSFSQNVQSKKINPQSLASIEEKSPAINNHKQGDFSNKIQQHHGHGHNQKQIQNNSFKQKNENNKNNILNNKINNHNINDNNSNTLNKIIKNTNINYINNSINDINNNINGINNNKHQKTFLIALDSELQLGFYTIS